MWQKIKCFFAELFKVMKWHDWETVSETKSEYEPELVNGIFVCKCCGKIAFYTRLKGEKDD